MTTQTAIHSSAKISDTVIASYVSDLEDAELLTRPGAGCNHLAWQLGHLISSEVQLLESIAPGKGIALPDGFNAAHSKAANGVDEADAFLSKQAYLDLYSDVRQASAAALDTATTAELDEDAPETFRAFLPDRVGYVRFDRGASDDACGAICSSPQAARQTSFDVILNEWITRFSFHLARIDGRRELGALKHDLIQLQRSSFIECRGGGA